METKKDARLRRAKKSRAHIRRLGKPRLTVFRSGRHIYAQVIRSEDGHVLAAASTLDKDLKGQIAKGTAHNKQYVAGIDRSFISFPGFTKAFDLLNHRNGIMRYF